MSRWDGFDEFLAVASATSFTRAARTLGVSVTHVSRSVMGLEHRLKAQLFHRTTRSVRLTDTGRLLYERCHDIARERDEAFSLIGDQGELRGELRMTCSTAMGERFVAPLMRKFAEPFPQLVIDLELSNRVVDIAAEGMDLAIRTGTVDDSGLLATRVASRRLHTCAAPAYLARAGQPETLEALSGHDCLVGSSATWHYLVDGRAVMYKPSARFRCNSGTAVIDACASGLGLCQLPDFYVAPLLDAGVIALVLRQFELADEPVWAVYQRRRHHSAKIRQAVSFLKDGLNDAMTGGSAAI